MFSSSLPACPVSAAGCCEVTLSGLLAARGHLRQEEFELQGDGDAPEAAELRERRDPGKCLPPRLGAQLRIVCTSVVRVL